MDGSPSGYLVHGILQARILEWFAIPFSRTRLPAITTAISTKLERVIRSPKGKLNCRYSHMTMTDFLWGAPKSLQMVTAAMKLKDAYSLEEKL